MQRLPKFDNEFGMMYLVEKRNKQKFWVVSVSPGYPVILWLYEFDGQEWLTDRWYIN
jgi:hypothetical protein